LAVKIEDLLRRRPVVPFGPDTGIPWDDPAFSERMLREHLCQDHDRASRRFEVIERQVAWIHEVVLDGREGAVLDLGCGPGLYTSRLAALGHRCVGVDFSPASIRYATEEARRRGLACDYQLADLRSFELEGRFDAVLLLFGEFNTFEPERGRVLLRRIRRCLGDEGRLLLEVQSERGVREIGNAPNHWGVEERGLFADTPHLTLSEAWWHAERKAATERYTILGEHEPTREISLTTQAYSDGELEDLLRGAGLAVSGRYASLGAGEEGDVELIGVVATPGA